MRHHLDREATFEELLFVEVMNDCRLCDERAEEPVVFFLRERAVQIIALATLRATRCR